ncbi:MAG: hypothetical protein K2X60_00485 [Xanthobacteraceae bacterium]|nr:hypothetical protein [Xanthobacteraceae bacterium]
MADTMTRSHASPTLVPQMDIYPVNAMSDDECVARLAEAVDRHDEAKLDELAALIGRLAVCIEI